MSQEKKTGKTKKVSKRLTKTTPPKKGPNPQGIYAPLKPEYYL